jgi:hypothetical protein
VPDDLDYAWLGRLTEHPEDWSAGDLATARQLVADQRRAIADAQPLDERTRRSMQEVVDGLEAAIEAYVTRRETAGGSTRHGGDTSA